MMKEGVDTAQALDSARTNYDVNKSRLAALLQADRSAEGGGRPRQIQRRASGHAQEPGRLQPQAAGGRGRAAGQGGCAPRLHRDSRADRWHRGRARGAPGRGRQSRAAGRHADQPGRPLGAHRRRGNLHRSRAQSATSSPSACRRAPSSRARSSTAPPTRASRRSATSAARSATSRRSRSACASTTRIAGSPSA